MNEWLERHTTFVLSLVGLLVATGVGLFTLKWQPVEPIRIEPPLPTQTPEPIRVYVSGAVAVPDVYTLPPGAIVRDAIQAAGGPAAGADISLINLAQVIQDGMQVYVPMAGEAVVQPMRSLPASQPEMTVNDAPNGPIVNINTATQAELETLPGIGPAIAGRIIEYRESQGPFNSIEDIMNVSGIGPATFEKMRALITVN
ncbi:MAG: helix-hairpin-helix domain-containing protein [Anaerolineae bacterium]|nr:helix-hairpin-helix domain-containing protein [Anaerolineae bacterium]